MKSCTLRQTPDQKKKDQAIERINEATTVEVRISCSKCHNYEAVFGQDEYQAAKNFYEQGWSVFRNRAYCPDCR